MRKVFFLVLLGLVAYVAQLFWQNPEKFRERFAGMFESASGTTPGAGTGAKDAKKDPATAAIRELTTFVSGNTETILAPITTDSPEMDASTLGRLKVRLGVESAKATVAADRARLQAAVQLTGLMEQAIMQRAEHVRKRRGAEYHEPPDTGSRTKVSPAEITAKMRQAEFFVRGVDKKWDDLAAQYRAAISRLVASVSA